MTFCACNGDNHGSQCRNHESGIDHEVGKEDEPSIAVALLELAGRLSARDRASRILAAYADPKQKAIGRQGCKHALDTPSSAIRAGAESCKDDEDDSADKQAVASAPVVTRVAENYLVLGRKLKLLGELQTQLAEHRPGKGDGSDILLC